MKLISEKKALERLHEIKSDFKERITEGYEHRAKSCMTCLTPGACCQDEHFVNVHISPLEAVAIRRVLSEMPVEKSTAVHRRIDETIEKYALSGQGDTYKQTFACPLFEKAAGCLVHQRGKPLPCIAHACYENAADLPPDELEAAGEQRIDALNRQTYGHRRRWLPIPLALRQVR